MTIRGLKFPFGRSNTSFPAKAEDQQVIEDNILRILLERLGERPMRSETGSKTWNFVFENTGPVLSAQADYEVRRALARGEPRITVRNVNVSELEDAKGDITVYIDVLYEFNEKSGLVRAPFPLGSST